MKDAIDDFKKLILVFEEVFVQADWMDMPLIFIEKTKPTVGEDMIHFYSRT